LVKPASWYNQINDLHAAEAENRVPTVQVGLDRIVAAVLAHTTADLFATISARLPQALRANIDLLVEVPDGDARSSLFRLKDYPKSANAAVIKGDIVRLRLIEQLVEGGAGLDDVDPRVVRQLGQLGRRYDAGDPERVNDFETPGGLI
jgi:hypothetical protein